MEDTKQRNTEELDLHFTKIVVWRWIEMDKSGDRKTKKEMPEACCKAVTQAREGGRVCWGSNFGTGRFHDANQNRSCV